MRLPDLLVPAPEPAAGESLAVIRRRRVTTCGTLVIGTALLAATLRLPAGSGWFPTLGLLVAATWIIGGFLSGTVPIRPPRPVSWRAAAGPAVAVGVAAFLAFVAARLVGQHLPVVSGALDNVLATADAGPLAIVLVVGVVNGVAEEVFFRGALFAALHPHRPALVSTVVYVVVTAATGNLALVAAAAVMGAIFSLERLSTHSVLAPAVTHVTWSTLMLLALPR